MAEAFENINDIITALIALHNEAPSPAVKRCVALAITKMEEAQLWLHKSTQLEGADNGQGQRD